MKEERRLNVTLSNNKFVTAGVCLPKLAFVVIFKLALLEVCLLASTELQYDVNADCLHFTFVVQDHSLLVSFCQHGPPLAFCPAIT